MTKLSLPVVNADLGTSKIELEYAARGIRKPEVIMLEAGVAVFRFASTVNLQTGKEIPSNMWARGAWWLLEEDYRKVNQAYQRGELGLGTVARSAAAVQPSWSKMDVCVKAYVLRDMNVYIGKGKTQYRDQLPNGMTMTLPGWPELDQLYIPGMRTEAFTALRIVRKHIITTDSFGF